MRNHGYHAVNPGLNHLFLMLVYFVTESFSLSMLISIFFSIFTFLGAFAIYKESKQKFFLLIVAPLFLVLFFSRMGILFVRNILVAIPVLAIFSARGIFYLFERFDSKKLKIAFSFLIIALVLINIGLLAYADYTVASRNSGLTIQRFGNFIRNHADDNFVVSAELYNELSKQGFGELKNVHLEHIEDATYYADFYLECCKLGPGRWPVNKPNIAPKIIGPIDINYDYYSQWLGSERIVIMTPDEAKKNKMNLYKDLTQ